MRIYNVRILIIAQKHKFVLRLEKDLQMIQKDLCKNGVYGVFYMRYLNAEKNIFSAFLFHQIVLTFVFLVCYYLRSYKIIETKLFLKGCDSNGLFPSSMTELYF